MTPEAQRIAISKACGWKKASFGAFTWLDKNGDMYVGKWEKNLRHGYGTMSYKNNTFYEGQWINNKKSRKNITKKSKK
jgi:hypothetical protein